MINNGIISIGDNNKNTMNKKTENKQLTQELLILLEKIEKNTKDYTQIVNAIAYNQKKEEENVKKCLHSFSKYTIKLISQLGLTTLQAIIKQWL